MERWFREFRRELSNRVFEAVELLQEALTEVLWSPTGGSHPDYGA